jgi:hypothetical protein
VHRQRGDAQWPHGSALHRALAVAELVRHRKLLVTPGAGQARFMQRHRDLVQAGRDVTHHAPAQGSGAFFLEQRVVAVGHGVQGQLVEEAGFH